MRGRPQAAAIIVGSYALGNLGDVALLMQTVAVLRRSYTLDRIAVYTPEQPYLQRLVPGLRMIPPTPGRIVRAELLVYGGGTQFYSFELTTPSLAGRIRHALLSPRAALAFAMRKAAAPFWRFEKRAALGLGIGPFVPGSGREESTRAVFGSLDFVGVRDRASFDYCAAWGIERAVLRSDLCFAGGFLDGAQPGAAVRGAPGSIGVVVREWPHSRSGAAYVGPLIEAARRLRERGSALTFYSFCEEDDRNLVARLRSEGYTVIVWDPARDDLVAFVRRLGAHEVVASARYHGAVFTALLGKPCICIELEQKLTLAADTLGCAEYLWRQPFDPGSFCALVDRVAAERSEATARVEAAVRTQRALADRMAAEFTAFVGHPV